jgi:hypothetical protein
MDRRDALIGRVGDRVAIWRGRVHCILSACPLDDWTTGVFPEGDHRDAPMKDVRVTEIG